eukprot:1159293-Pelagomonas_calceolata.AAC.4
MAQHVPMAKVGQFYMYLCFVRSAKKNSRSANFCVFASQIVSYTLASGLYSSPFSISSSDESLETSIALARPSCPSCLLIVPAPAPSSLALSYNCCFRICVMQAHADTLPARKLGWGAAQPTIPGAGA